MDLGRRRHVGAHAARHLLGGAEVGELGVTVERDEHVFRLKVAEDDIERVDVPEREGDLGRVDSRELRRERATLLQQSEDIATADVLHAEEEEGAVLGGVQVADDEGMRQKGQACGVAPLTPHSLVRIGGARCAGLPEALYDVKGTGMVLLREEDRRELARADEAVQLDRIDLHGDRIPLGCGRKAREAQLVVGKGECEAFGLLLQSRSN